MFNGFEFWHYFNWDIVYSTKIKVGVLQKTAMSRKSANVVKEHAHVVEGSLTITLLQIYCQVSP